MTLHTRYLLAQLVGPLLAVTGLLCGLLFGLQGMRLGHHLLGQGMSAWTLVQLLGLSLPTLLVFVLPFALTASLVWVLGRMEECGELQAMRIAGASPLRLAIPGGLLVLVCAGGALALAWRVEPAALGRLERLLARSAVRVLLLEAPTGQFVSLLPGTSLFLERRLPGSQGSATRFEGFFLARDSGRQILFARQVQVQRAGETAVLLDLADGELQQQVDPRPLPGAPARPPDRPGLRRNPDMSRDIKEVKGESQGRLRRVRFSRLTRPLDLQPALARQLGFVARLAGQPGRGAEAAAGCLGMGLLALALGLGSGGRGYKGACSLAIALIYQGVSWGLGDVVPGALGPVVLAMVVGAGVLGWLGKRSAATWW